MNIFFTGHRGFLGRELIPELERDFKVHKFPGNLLDFDLLQRFVIDHEIDKVIQAAARGGRRVREDSPHTLAENFAISVNIRNLGLPILHFCSGAIYNRDRSIDEASEGDSLFSYPNDFYGQSKFLSNYLSKDREDCVTLRYFNVFGKSEGRDRFITFNLIQYIKRQPMIVFKDFQMDFFYVQDTIPVLTSWINGANLPKEINLVYKEKLFLSDVCTIINNLSDYIVPIHVQDTARAKNYTGSGKVFESLKLHHLGLKSGIDEMYEYLKSIA